MKIILPNITKEDIFRNLVNHSFQNEIYFNPDMKQFGSRLNDSVYYDYNIEDGKLWFKRSRCVEDRTQLLTLLFVTFLVISFLVGVGLAGPLTVIIVAVLMSILISIYLLSNFLYDLHIKRILQSSFKDNN